MNISAKINAFSYVDAIQNTMSQQANALQQMAKGINHDAYAKALELMYHCKGHVIICGMGKSGHVGRKLSATLASTGTPSFFLHPAEAFHGDLGMITSNDVVILISNSGETDEILKLIPSLKMFGNKTIAITGGLNSTMAKNADVTLAILMDAESCPNNLAPTTSTTITMAMGDALAVALMKMRNFLPQDFARYHPGGALGRRLLTRVKDVMTTQVPSITSNASFKNIVAEITKGCQGLVIIVDENTNALQGIITDGDLRRAMEKCESFIQCTARDIMTKNPTLISSETKMHDAEQLMTEKRISSLLVSDDNQTVIGLIRIFD